MRIAIVGAGAVGGYFGGRLVEKGADVTFLVRKKRQEQLATNGLSIRSPHGNTTIAVATLSEKETTKPFDLIILAVKAYHLPDAIQTMKQHIDANTLILPLLNGYKHIQILQKEWGHDNILGGFCYIESTLTHAGDICLLGQAHQLVYGELACGISKRMVQLEQVFQGANFVVKLSPVVMSEMWNKYMFISALSGMTSLMRSSIGSIFASRYGRKLYNQLLQEIYAVAKRQSLPQSLKTPAEILKLTEGLATSSTSSMYRDLIQGLPLETEHLHGSLLRWGQELQLDLPILTTIYTALTLHQSNETTAN